MEFTDFPGDVKILAMSGSALGYLTVTVDNVTMPMLIDSGASYSTIDYTVYTSLETQPTLHEFTRPVWCAGLTELTTHGYCYVTLAVEDQPAIKFPVLVADLGGGEAVIGYNLLKALGALHDYGNATIHINGSTYSTEPRTDSVADEQGGSMCASSVACAETVTIQPGETMNVKVHSVCVWPNNAPGILSPLDQYSYAGSEFRELAGEEVLPRLMTCVVQPRRSVFYVEMHNPTLQACVIQANEVLGCLTQLMATDIIETTTLPNNSAQARLQKMATRDGAVAMEDFATMAQDIPIKQDSTKTTGVNTSTQTETAAPDPTQDPLGYMRADDDNAWLPPENPEDLDYSLEVPPHLQCLIDSLPPSLTETQVAQVKATIHHYADAFTGADGKIGRTSLVTHEIDTGTSRPIKQPPRRHANATHDIVAEEVEKMLAKGVIEPSCSPWASPVVIVRKKDGSYRFCVDYRRLNELTHKDAHPIPRLQDCLESLAGANWFSTLDLHSGYWQVAMSEEDKEKTAFATRNGLYQFTVMPFGLTNAPATFQRLMELILSGLSWEQIKLYLDDVLVIGSTFWKALVNLCMVCHRAIRADIRFKPPKCSLFQKEVSFLGHIVSPEGIRCDPAKLAAVAKWPVPCHVTDVRSFIGFCAYYRRFIPQFSELTMPLFELCKKNVTFQWTEERQEAFKSLKQALQDPPVLSYPKQGCQFILDTDASTKGLGAVLSQVQDGEERVIHYWSRALSATERNYCPTYLELLAVKSACNAMHSYLWGQPVIIRTDHASLQWLLNFKAPEGMLARWIAGLSEYHIQKIQHRPGRQHTNADAMSRIPTRPCPREDCWPCQEVLRVRRERKAVFKLMQCVVPTITWLTDGISSDPAPEASESMESSPEAMLDDVVPEVVPESVSSETSQELSQPEISDQPEVSKVNLPVTKDECTMTDGQCYLPQPKPKKLSARQFAARANLIVAEPKMKPGDIPFQWAKEDLMSKLIDVAGELMNWENEYPTPSDAMDPEYHVLLEKVRCFSANAEPVHIKPLTPDDYDLQPVPTESDQKPESALEELPYDARLILPRNRKRVRTHPPRNRTRQKQKHVLLPVPEKTRQKKKVSVNSARQPSADKLYVQTRAQSQPTPAGDASQNSATVQSEASALTQSSETTVEEQQVSKPVQRGKKLDSPVSETKLAADSHPTASVAPKVKAKAKKQEPPVPYFQDLWIRKYTLEDIKKAQEEDKDINAIRQLKKSCLLRPPYNDVASGSSDFKTYWTLWKELIFHNDILYRQQPASETYPYPVKRLVVPFSMRAELVSLAHDHITAGHLGVNKSYSKLKSKFYWVGCKADIQRWCRRCHHCALVKPGGERLKVPLVQIPVGVPMEKVAADLIGPVPASRYGNTYVIVVEDYFTKWVEAYPIPSKEAYYTADRISAEFFARYGIPLQFHSDQGTEFINKTLNGICDILNIDKTRTTPYRPASDGLVERTNRTLRSLLTIFMHTYKRDWEDLLPYVLMAYRSTEQESTGCTPNLMMFGRENGAPVDLQYVPLFPEPEPKCPTKYVEWLRHAMRVAHTFARKQLKKAAEKQRRTYNRTAQARRYNIGDWVYLRNFVEEKTKFGLHYKGPYLVVSRPSDTTLGIQAAQDARIQIVNLNHVKTCWGDHPVGWNEPYLGIVGLPDCPSYVLHDIRTLFKGDPQVETLAEDSVVESAGEPGDSEQNEVNDTNSSAEETVQDPDVQPSRPLKPAEPITTRLGRVSKPPRKYSP